VVVPFHLVHSFEVRGAVVVAEEYVKQVVEACIHSGDIHCIHALSLVQVLPSDVAAGLGSRGNCTAVQDLEEDIAGMVAGQTYLGRRMVLHYMAQADAGGEAFDCELSHWVRVGIG
jgi:hypothetical protein